MVDVLSSGDEGTKGTALDVIIQIYEVSSSPEDLDLYCDSTTGHQRYISFDFSSGERTLEQLRRWFQKKWAVLLSYIVLAGPEF